MDAITNFLGAGTVNIALKIGLIVLLLIVLWFILRWINQQIIDAARAAEQRNEVKDQQDQAKENKIENDQAKKDSKAVDDFLKG